MSEADVRGLETAEDAEEEAPKKRGRGRPPGSKNKPKAEAGKTDGVEEGSGESPTKRGRGRPPGSKNKPKHAYALASPGTSSAVSSSSAAAGDNEEESPKKRGRGRPPGSKNKSKVPPASAGASSTVSSSGALAPGLGWSLESRSFIVTGGTKGIGLATARSLLAHGAAAVMICSRSNSESVASQLEEECSGTGAKVYGVDCDVSTAEGRAKLVAEAKDAFDNCLDGLANNVGVNFRENITEQTPEQYHQMMRTNIDSAYFLCKDLKDLLANAAAERGSAAIVNVASAAGVGSTGTGAAYGLSKAAMIQLSKILACEWAKLNIRVNSVAPWMTMTPMLEEAVKNNPSQLDKVKEWTPMHRLPTVEEVAGPITYFFMPSSRYVTGQLLSVDGGLSAQAFDGPCVT